MSLVLESPGAEAWENSQPAEEGESGRKRYKPSPRQYQHTYQDLIDRDGHHCFVKECPAAPPYHIHHKYGDNWNWRLRDLQLACDHHNSSIGAPKEEREGGKLPAVTVHADEAASLEIIVSTDIFPLYRAWLYEKVLEAPITKKEAIYDGAMYLKQLRGYGSSQTTRRYLNELSAAGGPFRLEWDQVRGWIVKFRERRR
jgi:hypothetical protein